MEHIAVIINRVIKQLKTKEENNAGSEAQQLSDGKTRDQKP